MAEKKKTLNKFIPTGFTTLDIMFGENIRNPDTFQLEYMNRGFELGTQGILAGDKGTGKSTLALDAAAFGINIGFPCHKIIIIDADGEVYKENRIMNLSSLNEEQVKKYVKVYQEDVIEEIYDILAKESQEYSDMNYKPVEVYNPIIDRKVKMMPYVVVIIDTVSSLRASVYSGDSTIKGAKDTFSPESYLGDFNKLTRLCKTIPGLFEKNVAYIWVAHLKENKNLNGQIERDFKSAPIDKKISAPLFLKQKAAWALVLYKTVDTTDREKYAQKDNIITRLNLNSSLNAYSSLARFWKSRTGTEGATITELPNVQTKFNRLYNLILDCDNLGIFKKAGGMYPSADMPHIFKDRDEACSKEMSTFKREAKCMDGYDRPFNLMEARILMDYEGDNTELLQRKIDFISACMQNLECRLGYELEVNNKSTKELETNATKLMGIFNILGKIKRTDVLNPDDINREPTAALVSEEIANEGNNTNYNIDEEEDEFDE